MTNTCLTHPRTSDLLSSFTHNPDTHMNNITDIKLTTTAAARIAQNEIANKAIALFGSEAVSATCEIDRKTSESNGIVYNATARLSVTVDLRKTDLAKRWIAAAAAGIAKGLKADDSRITGQAVNQWDRETINLARLTGADANYKPQTIWSINVIAETYPRTISAVPYKNEWRQYKPTTGEWPSISVDEVVAITVANTASIDAIKAYAIEGTINGRRYDSNNRAFKVGTFIAAGIESASEIYGRASLKVDQLEAFVEKYDLAAETALIAQAEAAYLARKARSEFINGTLAECNRLTGAESRYDTRQIAEYSAEGLSAGRLDIRTSKLTETEVDAILAILTAASERIAAGKATESAGA